MVADRQRIPLCWRAKADTELQVKLQVKSQVVTQVDTALNGVDAKKL
jgi:hypothetical protein